MARNWAPVTNGGLGNLVDAYHQGVDRKRGIENEAADSQRKGEEWGVDKYKKPKLNKHGHVTGYESNAKDRAKDDPIYKNLAREYYRDPPSAPAPESAPVDYTQGGQQELSPSGRPMGNTYEDGNREPQSNDPKPLLRDPKAAQVDAQIESQERQQGATLAAKDKQAGEANKIKRTQMALKPQEGETGRTAVLPEGADPNRTFVDESSIKVGPDGVRRGTYSQVGITGDGAEVVAEKSPAAAPVNQPLSEMPGPDSEYSPSDYLTSLIAKRVTAQPPRASDSMISISSLPPALLAGTGLEGFKGQVPSSLLKDILSGKVKMDLERLRGANKQTNETMDSGVIGPIADDLRTGKSTLGAALEDFEVIAGRPPNKREEAVLTRVYQAREAELRAKQGARNENQKPPPGYRFAADGTTLEAIPGGPAAEKAKDKEDKKGRTDSEKAQIASVVVDDIDRALSIVKKNPRATGFKGAALSLVPGSDAFELNRMIDTIKANVTFDRLQQIRQNSPTGAAVGNVSDKDMNLLASSAGSLSPSMHPRTLEYNFNRIKQLYAPFAEHDGSRGQGAGGGGDLEAKAMTAIQAVESSGADASQKRTAIDKIRKEYEKRAGKPLSLKKGEKK